MFKLKSESNSMTHQTVGPYFWGTGMGSLSLPNPGIEPRSPTLWADSLPAEPQGKSKNTGVGSLSLLQRIFPTQESNWRLHSGRFFTS